MERFLTNLKTKKSAPKRPTTDTDNKTEPKKVNFCLEISPQVENWQGMAET
jgi:hypothetical protein